MMIKKLVSLVFLTWVFLLSNAVEARVQQSIFDTSASSLFSNENEFLKPDQAFNFNFAQNADHIEISFDIVDGYYLYKNKFVIEASNATIGEYQLPQGVDHEDEFFGKQQIYETPLSIKIPLMNIGDNAELMIRYQGCAKKGLCYPPEIKTIQLNKVTASAQNVLAEMGLSSETTEPAPKTADNSNTSEQHQLAQMLAGDNIWLTLAAFFLGGLLLSFTPCVFPMYPILTGIIVGQKNQLSTKRAFSLSFFYVQGMAITYTLLGIVVALAGAQFQAMFQHPVVLIILSALFIFLALSMFGVFNLALPNSWQNKLNNLSNSQKSGSYFGVLAMGAISGLVASPCTTAPLTGALLYISQSGDVALGAAALYALSIGMGLPLLILGSSGGKLLPKAGAWMNVIKNIFGLLLLAVPIFLLERFISANVIALLWLALVLSTGFYFIHITLSSAPSIKRHIASILVLIATMALVIYVTPQSQSPLQNSEQTVQEKSFVHVSNLAELMAEVKAANANGETVMVDLYADWCIACKEFEHKTFPKPIVQQALANTRLIQIDLTDTGSDTSVELMEHFDVFGLPSILFFDLNGKELDQRRVTGFMAAEEFATHVNKSFAQ
ncbi:protein-disulfide reductase DsbD [Thalassotalea marina]|uniref:Thiol:disulfide interchange protein DsbD n=1 Tax=Thalassotalea marina TaxID=1673741 RepID=A0A919BNT9_9GAMM|nr:protein-disulfide reductase DsbD [Thalassotalea marina]GHG04435.1 thiol:disulfide interchange protein DsbD [Thalassotalea marina]